MMAERARAWLDDLPASGRVVAFSHGGTIGSLLQNLVGTGPSGPLRFRFGNTAISRVLRTPTSLTLLSVNDTAHLTGLDAG